MNLRTFLILVIFSSQALSEEMLWPKGWYQVGTQTLEISTKVLEKKLENFLGKQTHPELYLSNQYLYQYKVSVGNIVEIQAICLDIPKRHDLNKEFLLVFDGGSCVYSVFYNTENDEFYNFIVNGEA
jgi:hypothetical protein